MPPKNFSSDALLAELRARVEPGQAPVRPAGPTPAAAPPAPGAPLPGTRSTPRGILIVEDDKDYRDIITCLLAESGYRVMTANDGREGLSSALSNRPDLVLLDFHLPELNGYEVIQELRSRDDTRKIPIILFTGAPNRKALKEMRLDIEGFLEKPASNAQLLAEVERVLKTPPPPAQARADAAPASPLAAAPPPPAPRAAPDPESGGAAGPSLEDLELEDLDDAAGLLVDIERDQEDHATAEVLEKAANDSPLINRVNKILMRAVALGASDIHVEPSERQLLVRVRVNGSLQELCSLPATLAARLTARIKIMGDLVIHERRLPQDGQFRATIGGRKIEFRVSTLPSTHGETIVIRILSHAKIMESLSAMPLSPRDRWCLERALRAPNGLILATGPTGSGKTTTLYSMLAAINKPDVKVMTAEDPIEYRLPGIIQVHVKPHIGLKFETVLRAFLRQDPDVMLIGEIRDLETADIAVKASITGHVVFSTLHTNSAPATVVRLAHMGLAPFLVAASLKLVVAQRLVKTLCPDCRAPGTISAEEKRLLAPEEAETLTTVYRAVGCRSCGQAGTRGRRPLFEVMPVGTTEMRELILSAASADALAACARREGMTTLRQGALGAVARGETSLAEALKIILSD